MQEIQQTIQSVKDYIIGVWIRKRYFLISSWLICPIGFAIVATLPNQYESEAQVFVDTRSVLAPLLGGIIVERNPDDDLAMMAQTLKSRDNIETIAREADLDINATTPSQYESLIRGLTEKIQLSGTSKTNVYTISYASSNPEVARNVVQETLSLFVGGALGGNRVESDNASRFLEEQLKEYETRLSDAEARRAEFQRQHNDVLSQSGGFNNNLGNLRSELSRVQLSIKEAQQQVVSLKARLENTSANTDVFTSSGDEDSTELKTRFDERIEATEERLDALRLRFTERHPDVIETEALLERLVADRDREISMFLELDQNAGALNPLGKEITLEISKLESLIASLRVREASFDNKIQELQSKLDQVPQIEAESISLNRNYNIIKQNYEQLLARKESAKISEQASISSEDLQFRVILPPILPQSPSGPKRAFLYTVVLLLGFGSGMGIAYVISQINPVLVSGQQLVALTGFPILGAVTHIDVDQIKRNRRTRMLIFLVSSGAIIAAYLTLVVSDVMNITLI